jgi:hypothetical protein
LFASRSISSLVPMCGLSTTIRGETIRHQNERDFPHPVELALPSGGFRGKHSEFDAFHRERRLQVRRGRGGAVLRQILLPLRRTAHDLHARAGPTAGLSARQRRTDQRR